MPKAPNFSEFITDYSPACYLTNYLIAAITIFYAYKYSRTYLDLNQSYKYLKKHGYFRQSFSAENRLKKKRNDDLIINDSSEHLRKRRNVGNSGDQDQNSNSYLSSYVFDQFLLNKRIICLYIILTNIFVCAAVLFSGLVHHFFYDHTKLTARIVWSAGVASLGLNCFFNIMFPLFLIFKISTIIQYRIILSITGLLATLLACEELIYEKMSFGLLTIVAAILMSFTACLPTFMRTKILNEDFRAGFRPKMLYIGTSVILLFTVYYMKIRPGCSVAKAFEQGLCPFPDSFNHNAALHIALAFTYWMCNRSFSKIFW